MLTDTDRRMLDFERRWMGRPGAKDAAIRAEFRVSSARYYQQLAALVQRRDAVEADPITVRRILEAWDRRVELRARRRVA